MAGGGNYTSENFMWTNTTPASSDKGVVIGRFSAVLSAGAGYTWSLGTGPTINFPIFETRWLSWVPTATGFTGALTYASHNVYKIRGNQILFSLYAIGTSNAAGMTFKMPLSGMYRTYQKNQLCFVYDNGNAQSYPGVAIMGTDNTLTVGKTFPSTSGGTYAGFTTSNTKGIEMSEASYTHGYGYSVV
jgi:hypothetical protein